MPKDIFKFDLDQYYAERDEIMNIPDETIDEYVKRVAAFRRSAKSDASSSSRILHSSSVSEMTGNTTLDLSAAGKAASHVAEPITDLPGPSRRTKEPQASDVFFAVGQSRVDYDQYSYSSRVVNPNLQSAAILQDDSTIGKPSGDLQSHGHDSLSMEEIDSFTVDMCNSPASPPKERIGKRKALDTTRTTPQKKRRVQQGRSPQASVERSPSQQSPISSFSLSVIDPPPQNAPLQRKEKKSTPLKTPKLDLCPLDEILRPPQQAPEQMKSTEMTDDPPTSPIEDPSAVLDDLHQATDHRTKPLESASSSRLVLDLQERISNHKSTKRRDKVMKLTSKPVLPEPSAGKVTARAQPSESSIINVSSSPSSREKSPSPAQPSLVKLALKRVKEAKAVAPKPSSNKKDDKTPRVRLTPVEYARQLNASVAEKTRAKAEEGPSNGSGTRRYKCLEGRSIFYAGGDMNFATDVTRKRMDLIIRHGGTLMPEYDPELTTEIVTHTSRPITLKALGLRKLDDIPRHIPVVRWEYVVTAIDAPRDQLEEKLGHAAYLHAAFSERMAPVPMPAKVRTAASFYKLGKGKAQTSASGVASASTARPSSSNSISPPLPLPIPAAPTSTTAVNGHLLPSNQPPGGLLSPPSSPIQVACTSKQAPTKFPRHIHTTSESEKQAAEDPLAEFYNRARQEREIEDGWSSPGPADFDTDGQDHDDETDSEHESEVQLAPVPRQKRGWTCDDKNNNKNLKSPNEDIIDKLTELKSLHEAKLGDEEHWRTFTLSKAIRALRSYPRRIKNYEEARNIRGIGQKTARKIEEILQTGELRRIGYENTEEVQVIKVFQGIYGVGRNIARKWYLAGCRTLSDLAAGKNGVTLSTVQKIGLEFYDDINDRMPRAEAKAIFDLIRPIALSINSGLFVEIMGSYRRGKADCGDIDILITRPTTDGSTHRGVMPRLIQELHSAGILTEDLALPDDPYDLEGTYRGLCRLPGVKGAKRRRIDILTVPWTSRGAALLYYTGDDIFNRAIRLKANVMGYSLNQKGLFGNIIRDTHDRRIKLNEGVLVASETEEKIFEILGVPWQEPHERVRG